MKKQVQQPGVRKWFGDDFISMQNELFSVLEGFFGNYGQQFILSGCIVNGNDISAGIVGLIDGTGFHLCSFSGVQGTAWPVYLYPSKITENRAYLDNQVKPVSENWTVAASGNNPGGYFQLKQDGTSARFFDAIQTANRRFVTDAEKTGYAAQASAAITTIRGGVAADYDTMAKIVTAMLLLAAKDSPALTGTPTAPTAAIGTNSTQIANTSFVQAAIAALVASSPAALDTLNELATALGNDPNFATTITNALALKAPLASPTLSGTPTAPTAPTATNTLQIANTAFVKAVIASLGLENMLTANSPALTGVPTAPTAAPGTNTTQIANTAFIQAALTAILNNIALTGIPTVPTAAPGTNTNQAANTAFVQAAIAALVASSPAALDTLNELAAALGNDANFAATMTNALANKLNRNFDNISNVVGALTALNVEGSAVLAGTDIDWSGKPIRTKTLTVATTLTFSNLIANKTITLRATGAFTLTLPTSVSMVSGAYDGTKVNLIQLLCVDSVTPEVWCVISQKQ